MLERQTEETSAKEGKEGRKRCLAKELKVVFSGWLLADGLEEIKVLY